MPKKIAMNLQKSTLYKYAELLANCKRARLTGTRGAQEIYDLQIMDCVPSLEFVPDTGKIIDVGSGGGLPGIVWAICKPDIHVTLLDSINKKCEATREIVDALGLNNVSVVCIRCEEFSRTHEGEFDLAAARAVGSIGLTAELLAPLVKTGGKILTFKGKKVHDEISEVNNQWRRFGLSKPTLNFYGGEDSSKCIVTWEKEKRS